MQNFWANDNNERALLHLVAVEEQEEDQRKDKKYTYPRTPLYSVHPPISIKVPLIPGQRASVIHRRKKQFLELDVEKRRGGQKHQQHKRTFAAGNLSASSHHHHHSPSRLIKEFMADSNPCSSWLTGWLAGPSGHI